MQSTIVFRPRLSPRPVTHRRSQTKAVEAVREVHAIKPLVRWAFYAFVFSILFEEFPIGVPLEMTQISGGLLVAAALLVQPRVCFRRPPAAFWCFAAYFCVGIGTLFSHGSMSQDALLRQIVLIQLIFMFWLVYNVMRDEGAARGALLALAASCLVLSLLQILGLTSRTEATRLGRFSAYGLDSNHMAGVLSLGVIALVGLVYGSMRSTVRSRLVIWPIFAVIGLTIIRTGSRGALLALAAGLFVFTLNRGTILTKLRSLIVILAGIGVFSAIAYQSKMIKHRFQVTLESGEMSRREDIYPLGFQMFLEQPVLGWGPWENTVELGNRMQVPSYERLDTHNQILYVLTATGILGGIPFLIGIWLCARAAWRARGGAHGILPLAMTVFVLVAGMSSSGLHWKQYWVVLAYAMASGGMSVIRSQPVRSKIEPVLT